MHMDVQRRERALCIVCSTEDISVLTAATRFQSCKPCSKAPHARIRLQRLETFSLSENERLRGCDA